MTKAGSNTERLYTLLGDLSPELLATAFPEAGGVHNAAFFRVRHAKRIGKMIALYAACVLLFLGALWLIPKLFPRLGNTPVGTDRTNDTTPIVTTAPVTTTPPITTATSPTTTVPTPPEIPQPEKSPYEQCLDRFLTEYAQTGNSLELTNGLALAELSDIMKFLTQTAAQIVVAGGYVSYYRPEDISLYDMLYAADIKIEFPDNPFRNDGSLMSVSRIREVIRKYMGIEVTEAMWDRLVADGAAYYPEYDTYGFPHTDAWGFFPENISGYRCADGKLLVYSGTLDNDINMILLIPTNDGYLIEAVQRIPYWELD